MSKNDVKIYFQKEKIYIYTTIGIYKLLISENEFYSFLNLNTKKGYSVAEGLEILEDLNFIEFCG